MISSEEELPANVIKSLLDKNTEKRYAAGQYLEIIVAKSIEGRNLVHVYRIITEFSDRYIRSQTTHYKKCGLEALTWIAQGLKGSPEEAGRFIEGVVRPVIECFSDSDQKIKYTAIKSLYYICKFLEEVIVRMFNVIFEAVLRRMSDPDDEIKNAAELLNGTLKTIISDALSDNIPFELTKFMGIITEHLGDPSSNTRGFLIDWINTIDEVPSIDLSIYLPSFLEDVLFMLGDKEKELRMKAEYCLKAFLFDLKEKFYSGKLEQSLTEEHLNSILGILIDVCKGKSSAFSKLTAIVWLEELFTFFREQVENKTKGRHKFLLKKIILSRFDQILEPILYLLSYEEYSVQRAAITVNEQLLSITEVLKKYYTINFNNVMPLLKNMLNEKKSSTTSESVLTWMKFLLENYNDKILPEINDIIQKLVYELCDGTTKNVKGIIENVSLNYQYFDLVIAKLLSLLFQNKTIEFRTEEILRKFCDSLDPEKTYISVCSQLLSYEDGKFIEGTVEALNSLLATYKVTLTIIYSLMSVRRKLRKLDEPPNRQLFYTIFRAFSYNTVAVVTLCSLAEYYRLAYEVIVALSREQISNETIASLCKFVNFLESPNFIYMRLQMLERSRYPYLVESIYSLMMLLPQGKIYTILKNRVDTVNHVQQSIRIKHPTKVYNLNYEEFINLYREIHSKIK